MKTITGIPEGQEPFVLKDNALRAADRLDVGTVKVNAVFGGAPGGSADPRRDSGQGAGYGPDLLAAMTRLKAVHLEAPPR